MPKDFHDVNEAAHLLVSKLDGDFDAILSFTAGGKIVGDVIAEAYVCDHLHVADGEEISPLNPELRLLVVDDAVESGAAAHDFAQRLHAQGLHQLTLAVPLCPRESIAKLQHDFDRIVAVVTPLMRRALSWHYEVLPPR